MARNSADIIRQKIAQLQDDLKWAKTRAAKACTVDAIDSYYFQVKCLENKIKKLEGELALIEAGWGSITA